jgi:hypothetical protein
MEIVIIMNGDTPPKARQEEVVFAK